MSAKKIIKYVLLVFWYLWCLNGIIKNYSHYKLGDWIIIFVIMFLPNAIMWIISFKRKKGVIKNDSAISFHTNTEIHCDETLETVSAVPLTQYIESDNAIYRTDEEPISNEEVPYLMQAGYKKALQAEKDSQNPKFHRTTYEKDLEFNFGIKYEHKVSCLTEKFESLYREACKTSDFNKKITLLNDAIDAFEKAKKFCYSKGKGGTIYFQDLWENLHNSERPCFSYLDMIQDSLKEATYLRNTVIPQLLDIIVLHDGTLQKDIYKLLPDINKSLIQYTVKLLEENNIISKTKKGNSYELHIIK